MSELGEKRRQFSKMLGLLLHYADYLGYTYSLEQSKRCKDCPIGHPKSTHKVGLAQDINLFQPWGDLITDETGHKELHDFWDFLGGAERIKYDMNHYSLEYNGVR